MSGKFITRNLCLDGSVRVLLYKPATSSAASMTTPQKVRCLGRTSISSSKHQSWTIGSAEREFKTRCEKISTIPTSDTFATIYEVVPSQHGGPRSETTSITLQ